MEIGTQILQGIGYYAYRIYADRDLGYMYSHLLLSALFPIYTGSHASLRRPPGVTKQDKTEDTGLPRTEDSQDYDDDDLDVEAPIEGLTPSDAIMFPVLAGCVLAGLYFLIKWLEDPALLNKILGWYFSGIGVLGVGKLAGDALNVGTTFVFPDVWSSSERTYFVDATLRKQIERGSDNRARGGAERVSVTMSARPAPFPGIFSCISLTDRVNHMFWASRSLFTDSWILRGYVHGLANIKMKVRLNDVFGLVIGCLAIIVYNMNGKAWWLTNLMGFGFSYGTLQLMTPTTFGTGSLVLLGLFIYDIVMVFYTPLMVTVATSLDVPIKLVFPGPKRGGMLGLGDVVLPGIMIALALRFDLYIFYLRKHKALIPLNSDKQVNLPANGDEEIDTQTISKSDRPIYHTATGNWGERYWTSRSWFMFRSSSSQTSSPSLSDEHNGGMFPKTYFYTSMAGYIIGMLITLFILNVYNHAQPALLYLVPSVLGSLWGMALLRGELKEMWAYTEDGSLDNDDGKPDEASLSTKKRDEVVPDGGDGKAIEASENGTTKEAMTKTKGNVNEEHAHHVFIFSLSSPKSRSSRARHQS